MTLLNGRNLAISHGLVEMLQEANNTVAPPAWLIGMAHVSKTRKMDEEQEIAAASAPLGIPGVSSLLDNNDDGNDDLDGAAAVNEQFTGQDFRRTAVEGSYGLGKDISYRSFDDEAYSGISSFAAEDVESDDGDDEDTGETDMVSAVDTDEDSQFSDTPRESDFDDNDGIKEEDDDELERAVKPAFARPLPSKNLLQTLQRMYGSKEIGDSPSERTLKALSSKSPNNQRLRFEYLGLFPFHTIYPLLSKAESSKEQAKNDGRPRILMVAEKPSIAEAIANALSGPRGPRKRQGISRALPVYEFTTTTFEPINKINRAPTPCVVTVTSVLGHIFSLGFDSNGPPSNPGDFFHVPVVKQEVPTTSKLRVVEHLRALAAKSDQLVLWLDCDAEGENIAHEVLAVTRRALFRSKNGSDVSLVHRAHFSAITKTALRDAFSSLEEPDASLSWSVDARQELDLRVGVALTRLLSWRCVGMARKYFAPATKLISYGPCQTPTLSFCVKRAREIEQFQAKEYSRVNVQVLMPGSAKTTDIKWLVPSKDQVPDIRRKGSQDTTAMEDNATFDKRIAQKIVDFASTPSAYMVVEEVDETCDSMPPPVGLNTVSLLKAGSKALGMSPKTVMNVAEKLYSSGFISYPRTETTKYDPNGFDVRTVLKDHASHEDWGRSASYLLRTKYAKSGRPPSRGSDFGDHPPITPLKAASRQDVGGGSSWRIYEFIVRNFLGSLHNEMSYVRRKSKLKLVTDKSRDDLDENLNQFSLELVSIDSLGFGDCCRWVLNDIGASKNKDEDIQFRKGQKLPVAIAQIDECLTRPPKFLQEHELIRLMDENRIGTDASMAVHVTNVVDRGYVVLCDELGVPLRPPMPPRPGQAPRPRQVGRYMVPTSLGMSLLHLFDGGKEMLEGAEDSLALLSQPAIRRQMEEEVKQISLGTLDKEECLRTNLVWFESRYQALVESLTKARLKDFGNQLTPLKENLKYWSNLGAFEEKPQQGGGVNRNRHPKPRSGRVQQRRHAVGSKSRQSFRSRQTSRA